MARAPGTPINERVAVVENKLDQLHDRLEKHENHVNSKLDQILDGQKIGQEDRKDMRGKMQGLSDEVKAMKPHVKTVADGKTVWKGLMIIGVFAATVSAAFTTAWAYIKPYILFQLGK
jgi:hypothetical protein